MSRGKKHRYIVRKETLLPALNLKEVWCVGDRNKCTIIAAFETEQEARNKRNELENGAHRISAADPAPPA